MERGRRGTVSGFSGRGEGRGRIVADAVFLVCGS